MNFGQATTQEICIVGKVFSTFLPNSFTEGSNDTREETLRFAVNVTMCEKNEDPHIVDLLWGKSLSTLDLPEMLAPASSACPDPLVLLRSHERYDYRVKAILIYNNDMIGVVTKDLSRSGIGFYSPVAIGLNNIATLLLPGPNSLRMSICRCIKVCDRCYECGGSFNQDER